MKPSLCNVGSALALLAALMPVPPLHAAQGETSHRVLANGMKVIVMEDHRAPTVASMVWYRAGSMDETSGTTGVAHVLEHMMFKGTVNNPGDRFSKTIAQAGGKDNAFTSKDYTAYFQQLHKDKLSIALGLEADRMRNLVLSPEEFAKEIRVVMEERRMRTDDKPRALLYEQLMAAAYTVSAYKWPIIGWMNDLENMTWQDARDWYRQWYAPNNAYVVVVGDVDHREVFRLAQKFYGPHKAKALPERKPQNEPEQAGVRRVTVKAPAKLPYLAMAWKAPKLRDVQKDRDPYALEVLAAVLDGHDASRFSKNLVRGSRIAQSAGAGYDGSLRGEATFTLDGQPAEGKTIAELEAALRAELKRIQDEGVSAEELARVKTQSIAAQTYKRDSLMAQAMEIGGIEATGLNWRDVDTLLEKLKTVTAEEVQAVAKKYFTDDTLSIAVLDPQAVEQSKPRKPSGAVRH
jgi:zinc protease